ncbi:hypothetical protein GCM10020000_77060 [Streptomyces olivoverticillatus]
MCGPAGHVLAPTELVAPTPDRERTYLPTLLAGMGLAIVRTSSGQGADDAVLWLRLGLAERLMDAVLDHLGTRSFGETPLLRQPVLKDALAEVAVGLLRTESSLLDAPGFDDTALSVLHQQLDTAEHALLKLLGGTGLTTRGPGADAYVSGVLADLYAPSALPQETA